MVSRAFTKAVMYPRRRQLSIREKVEQARDTAASIELIIESFRRILQGHASRLNFEQLFREVYKVVLRKQGPKLLTEVKTVVDQALEKRFQALGKDELVAYATLRQRDGTSDEKREEVELKLFELKQVWSDAQLHGGMISDVLMYMDRRAPSQAAGFPISDMTLLAFGEFIHNFHYVGAEGKTTTLQQVLVQFFMEQLDRHRSGDIVDMNLLEKTATCFRVASQHLPFDKSPYHALEAGILEGTRAFYGEEARVWSKHASAAQYSSQVSGRVSEEIERCATILGEQSAKKVGEVVKDEFEKHFPTSIDSQSGHPSGMALLTGPASEANQALIVG